MLYQPKIRKFSGQEDPAQWKAEFIRREDEACLLQPLSRRCRVRVVLPRPRKHDKGLLGPFVTAFDTRWKAATTSNVHTVEVLPNSKPPNLADDVCQQYINYHTKRLHRAAAHMPAPTLSPASTTTTASTTTINTEFPRLPKEIEKLWQKNTRKAAKTAYQNNYVKNGFPLTADQTVIDRATRDAIAANTSVEQHDVKLRELEQTWCREKTSLFPDHVRSVFAAVRTRLVARDAKRTQRTTTLANKHQTQYRGVGELEQETRGEEERGEREEQGTSDAAASQPPDCKPLSESPTASAQPAPPPLASPRVRTVFDTTLHEPARFDWAAEVDVALGLSPPIPTKPAAAPITSQMAPHVIDARLPASPAKTSTDKQPQVPSKPPSPSVKVKSQVQSCKVFLKSSQSRLIV